VRFNALISVFVVKYGLEYQNSALKCTILYNSIIITYSYNNSQKSCFIAKKDSKTIKIK